MSNHIGSIDVTDQTLTVTEYLRLRRKSGLSAFSPKAAEIGLKGTLFAVTLRQDSEAVGMGRVVGDGVCFSQIVGITVVPRLRGKRLGKKIMTELIERARNNLPETAFPSLLTDVPANKLLHNLALKKLRLNLWECRAE